MNDKFFKSKLNEIDTLQLKLVAKGDYLFQHFSQLSDGKLRKFVIAINDLAIKTVDKLQSLMDKEPTNLQFIEMTTRLNSNINLQTELVKFEQYIKKD